MHGHSWTRWPGVLTLLGAWVCLASAQPANQLTDEEKAAGWRLLFDGNTTDGWRSFKKRSFPEKGWAVEDGWLRGLGKGGGDIISDGEFEEFELRWEWKLAARGNSGVKYFVPETRPSALGHEYQMWDQGPNREGGTAADKHSTASFYDVLKPAVKPPVRPAGEVNESRVVVRGNQVEHWLNGTKVLDYECGSEGVNAAVAASKFRNTPGFGTRLKGHILLQDHGSQVWFRNIKIRDLTASKP